MSSAQQIAWLQGNVTALQSAVAANGKLNTQTNTDLDEVWLIICGALVFFMQAGFAMLEAGAVRQKNTINILYKNILDGSIASICFWLLGWGFAYGTSAGGFIGTDQFALSDASFKSGTGFHGWFFQFAFAATAATIVSGSVAERTKFSAYFIFSGVITTFIYPVVVHWGWGSGWLSAWGATDGPLFSKTTASNGMIDFAGSGVVHMVGGCAGLMGAYVVGPRDGRFEVTPDGKLGAPKDIKGHSATMMALGVLILWFGWYGFNCGSTLALSGGVAKVAGKVAATTTVATGSACITAALISKSLEKKFDVGLALNGILAGLISITAGCVVVDMGSAFVIGMIGSFVYYGASKGILKLHIDDPLDAFPLHGACGAWGVISVGIFATDANVQYAGYPNVNTAVADFEQLGVQVVGVLAIAAWSLGTSFLLFKGIDMAFGMRVEKSVELEGLDISEHGGIAYELAKLDVEAGKKTPSDADATQV